jgi:C4-dicarboxylate transporter DctM subunit
MTLAELAPFALFGFLLLFMFLKVPISWSLALSSLIAMFMDGNYPITVAAQRVFVGANVFSLLAVPFFILAGDIMVKGGLSNKLVKFADSLIGFCTGGLSLVSIIACTFFAAISGSSVATTAAIGGILLDEMSERGYPKDYSAAIQAIGGTLGIVIPPSIVFVLYGTVTNVSIVDLLMSGIIPGCIASFGLCLLAYYLGKKRKFPKSSETLNLRDIWRTFKGSFFALLMPIIILGGIYLGIFTPTESAVIAVLYGLFIAMFIYKDLKFKDLPKVFVGTARTTANLMILTVTAQYFGWMVTIFNIPTVVTQKVMAIAHTPSVFLFLVIILLIICGMFLEVSATVLILGPILAPIARAFGINDVHFGMLIVFLLAMGQATPPFGTTLFVAVGISKEPISKVSRQLLPFIGVEIACSFLFAYVPFLSTWLPETMKALR